MTNTAPHIILGISPDATEAIIKKTFRRLAKNWHPDRYQGSKKYGEEQFNRIKEAHDKMLSKEYQEERELHINGNSRGFNRFSSHNNNSNPTNSHNNFTNPNIYHSQPTNRFPFGVMGVNHMNPNGQGQQMPQMPHMRQMPQTYSYSNGFNSQRPRPASASVLCNGTVLLSGGFRPSQMTPEMLRNLQNNVNINR